MVNIFSEIEDNIILDESIIFEEDKIKKYIFDFIANRIALKTDREKPFLFEEVIYDFFDYKNINLIRTKKTRDLGIDGVIKLKLDLLGELNLGLQVKYRLIDSNDIDLFLSALRNAELQLGVVVCRDSRKLEKYELNSKIRAILLSKGIKIKERLIKENIDINPIFILKLNDLIEIVASEMRAENVTGAYYTARLSLAEYLEKINKQAACLVMREERPEYYAPLGVGILRELGRDAFSKAPERFETIQDALERAQTRLKLPIRVFKEKSWLLKNYGRQTRLNKWF